MSDPKEEIFNNLKVVIAENLKTLPNFNEDVNYVAEYIVLLMSNGGNLESVVQELTSLFDTVPPEAFHNVVQNAYKVLGYLQGGDSLEVAVSKLTGGSNAPAGQEQHNQQAMFSQEQQQQQQSQQQPQHQAHQQQPQQQAAVPSIFQTAPPATAAQPQSAFAGLVEFSPAPSGDISKSGGAQRGGGVGKASTRGGRNERPGRGGKNGVGKRNNYQNNNALAMALGMDDPNTNVVQKKQGRCKLFPRCPLGRQCPHAHPTQACREYPNCPNPPGTCNYLHPNEDVELMKEIEKTREEFREKRAAVAASRAKPINTGIVLCKFGNLCSNPQCPFGHPTPANEDAKVITFAWCPENLKCENPTCDRAHSSHSKIKEVAPIAARKPSRPPVEKSLEQCKFGQNCTNKRCKFRHARSHIMCREGANCTRIDCLFGHPINEDCKFGVECRNIYCLYRHPEGRQLPDKSQQAQSNSNNTWVNPNLGTGNSSSNERPFAVPENQVIEAAPAQEQDAMMN
ncbi:mRNA-binding protein NAB2 [Lachancea thermotolerans CBS 6340]|uniref:KLTH0H06226p n=1 Tax=Lachancea thermotolerans (strain ATCC 56472 / CBS 6340 / NRRL Y-8284) TaxID=559295 RepID=C5E2M7_LACTC|nr:KLTH0H06226p [Lachancea thermotolerans CBS 6340]CAR30288.1 KLTH0H06226p [Lachancea thermotolerans CBS 6340]